MKKLKLDLDALAVETFNTLSAPAGNGTVLAHRYAPTQPYTACFTCVTCVGVTCP